MSEFDEVAQKIKDRECVLFLGAGCSLDSSTPSGKTLYKVIVKQFVGKSGFATDLTKAFDIACGRDETNRPDVEAFLWDIFRTRKPNKGHEIMRQFRWPAIFTTNYDTLVEDAFKEPDRAGELFPVYSRVKTEITLNNPDVIPFFKLFGCISAVKAPSTDLRRPLILTTKDFVNFREDREWMLDALLRLRSSNTWLFIGYSFADGIILNLLNELQGTSAWRYLPKCYVVLPDVTEKDKVYLETYKQVLINDTFTGFFEKLDAKYTAMARRLLFSREVPATPCIRGTEMEGIDPKLHLEMNDQFDVLDDRLIERECAELLFRGYKPSWGDVERGNAIRRKEEETIRETIRDDVDDPQEEPKFYILAAAAGAGKSTLLKQVGFYFYQQGLPVLWLHPYSKWKIETFEKVYKLFDQRLLVLVDDGHLCFQEATTLFYKLKAINVPITMLIALKGDYNVLSGRRQPFEDIEPDFHLSHELKNPDELRDLVLMLERKDFINFDSIHDVEYWIGHFERKAGRVLLVIMMEATRGKRFDEIVIEEYDALSGSVAQDAYAYLCASHQYGIPLKQELLVPALECDWEVFLREIRRGQAELTIIEQETEPAVVFYQSRHTLIARKVAEAIFPTPQSLAKVVEGIIRAAYPKDQTQERIVLELLRNEELAYDLYSFENREKLFLAAMERLRDNDQVLLHYAILLSQHDKYDEAEDILNKALNINEDNVALIHYLGVVYRDKARTRAKSETVRKKLFRDAERQFELACRRFPDNGHSYHTHAEMLLDMKRHEVATDEQKDAWLAKALNITTQGLKLIPYKSQKLVRDLHHAILAEIGDIANARIYFEKRTEAGASVDTWALWARTELEGGEPQRSLEIAKKALVKWPDNVWLKLVAGDASETLLSNHGLVTQDSLEQLRCAADLLSDRADIRLRYAVALFIFGNYSVAESEFRSARKILPDDISPTYYSYRWVEKSGDPREVSGKAVVHNNNWTAQHQSSSSISKSRVCAGPRYQARKEHNVFDRVQLLRISCFVPKAGFLKEKRPGYQFMPQ